ncbi:MAG: tetratricopeptide repeat protein, partial [Anaerolineae bacterium]|nr:tetratricopeptide repeat protein [Anaerolineae bacterium]
KAGGLYGSSHARIVIDKPTEPPIDELLAAAIVAAKGKQPAEARDLLRRVLARDPANATAWLWMSGVIDDPLKRESCLQRVLELDPEHPVARRGLPHAQHEAAAQLLAQGIRAAEAGKTAQAHKLLTDVVVRDEQNLDAWVWLSRVVERVEDREVCYENVLTLDPDNEEAQVGLALLQENGTRTGETGWEMTEPEKEGRIAATLAGDILGEAYREKHTTAVTEPEPEPASQAEELWSRYENPYRCPYCAAETAPDDRRCPACRNRLWVKSRVRERRSMLLWILIALQAASTAGAAAVPFLAALFAGYRAGIAGTGQLLAAYLGLPNTLSAATLAGAHAVLPPFLFWLLWLPALYGLVVTIGLFFRWPIVFYGMLVSSLIGLVSSLGGIAITDHNVAALIVGAVGIALAVANVVIVLQLEDNFKVRRSRLLLGLDPGLKTGFDYLGRGRTYASRKMWAQAALHFRRAAALMPNQVDGLAGLAQACSLLGDLDLAEWALETALTRIPDHPQIKEALAALRRRRGAAAA